MGSSNSKKNNSLIYMDSHQNKNVLSSISSNSMEHSSSKCSDTHEDKQVFPSIPSKSALEYSSSKYSDTHQDKQVFPSIPSKRAVEYSSSKYSDTHQDQQVFPSVPSKCAVKYSFVKHLDSHEESCSSIGSFIDIENPYYENDCTPPEVENSDFILGYSVDPYSEVSRTPPEDLEIDYSYDADPYYEESDSPSEDDWVDNSNYDVDSHLEGRNSPLVHNWACNSTYDVDPYYEEWDWPPENDWADNSNYDVDPCYEESDSPSEGDWVDNTTNYVVDSHYEQNDLRPEHDWACNSIHDVAPHYEERDSPPENDWACNSKYDVDPYYEKNYSLPTNKDKKEPFSVSSNRVVEYNSHQETFSNAGSLRDLKSPFYKNDLPLSERKKNDFISGISVDQYYQEYDSSPSLRHDGGLYSNCDKENDWKFNSNSDIAPHSGANEYLAVKNEHSLLLRFYDKLVDDLMKKFAIGYYDICSSLKHMIRNHSGVFNGKLPSETDYCNQSYCLGYLHRYAACHSVMILDSVSALLKSSSSNVLSTRLNREQLNVMFLGGGPGNDFLGFLIALYSYRNHLLDLDVTVVDKMSGWREVFKETVQKLKLSEYGKLHQLFKDFIITTSFIPGDLKNCQDWNTNMQNKLKRADLVFLVKVLSHIPNDDKLGVLQNIILHTKPGALLIYVDHPYPQKAFASVSRSLRPVYKSNTKSYNLKATKLKFGYRNITRCTAEMRVFERQ